MCLTLLKVPRCLGGPTQLNFFCSFDMTDLEGRSRAQDGPHHTTLWPGSSGACCIPVGEVLTEPVQLCVGLRLLQQVTVHARFFTGL